MSGPEGRAAREQGHGPSRRAVIVGGGLVLGGGVVVAVAALGDGDDGGDGPPEPAPTSRAPEPDAGEAARRVVLDEAAATTGVRLLGSPWARWAGRPDGSGGADDPDGSGGADNPDGSDGSNGSDGSGGSGGGTTGWDGLYVSWLLRRHGGDPAATAPADLLALVRERGEVGVAPSPGALVFYDRELGEGLVEPDQPARVGMVVAVTGVDGDVLAQTVEGDHPAPLPHSERFVRLMARPGPGPVVFAMPRYAPDDAPDEKS